MFRNALFASVIALGVGTTAGAAQAQDHGPRLVGGGVDTQLVYDAPSRNIVGGGIAGIAGGGDDRHLTYAPGATTEAPDGRVATLVGGGADTQLVYGPASAATSATLAGRGARPQG